MSVALACKNCGEKDSIVWKFDAWAIFEITGTDEVGSLTRSVDFQTQILTITRSNALRVA
jgi:hypothetical protein